MTETPRIEISSRLHRTVATPNYDGTGTFTVTRYVLGVRVRINRHADAEATRRELLA